MGFGLNNELVLNVFSTAEMREVFDDKAMLQGWLDTEKALSLAQGDLGIIPEKDAQVIAENCAAKLYDMDELAGKILETGHPLVPIIRELIIKSGASGKFAHWGATTQDIVDTGLMLQCRDGLEVLKTHISATLEDLIVHAKKHRDLPMTGRTHFQHAAPITMGKKIAIWIDDLSRILERMSDIQMNLTGQFAGAVGNLSALDGRGVETRDTMCALLELKSSAVPWHTTRDRVRDIVNVVLDFGSAAERVGIEVALMQATELQEASEPISDKHVGSSTMPQKRNPHSSEFMVTAGRMMRGCAMPLTNYSAHSHEREMTCWALEWIAVPQVFGLASGAAQHLRHIAEGLVVNCENITQVLQLTNGQIMSESLMMRLAKDIGHEEAHEVIYECAGESARENVNLKDVVIKHPIIQKHLDMEEIDAALDPATYLGDSMLIVDAAIDGAKNAIMKTKEVSYGTRNR